jgi:hypothetical protein
MREWCSALRAAGTFRRRNTRFALRNSMSAPPIENTRIRWRQRNPFPGRGLPFGALDDPGRRNRWLAYRLGNWHSHPKAGSSRRVQQRLDTRLSEPQRRGAAESLVAPDISSFIVGHSNRPAPLICIGLIAPLWFTGAPLRERRGLKVPELLMAVIRPAILTP